MIVAGLVGGRPAGRVHRGGAIGIFAGTVMLMAAVTLAQAIPGLERLGALPANAALDYSTQPGSVAPLSEDFIASVLGPGAAGEGIDGASPSGARGGTGPGSPDPDEAGRSERTVADHAASNDRPADAYVIPSIPFSGRTDMSEATRTSEEPSGCGSGPTIWYRYTPGVTEPLNASASGTRLSMGLAVYEGGPGAFRRIGCDAPLAGAAGLVFDAAAGVEYWFQVSAPSNAGTVVFNLDPLGTTERVSLATDGTEPNSVSWYTRISGDGRIVMFESWASNLVADDDNESLDVFWHDRETGVTERASVNSNGVGGNGNSGDFGSAISANGRFIAFHAGATNLVPHDTNDWTDVFVHDRLTKETTRVSVASDGSQGVPTADMRGDFVRETICREVGDQPPANRLEEPIFRDEAATARTGATCSAYRRVSISGDGRYVVFESLLGGLTPDDVPRYDPLAVQTATSVPQDWDVFLHDRLTGRTTLVSVASDGTQANAQAWGGVISDDGTHVVFQSRATNLSPLDTGGNVQLYLRDLRTGATRMVSVSNEGVADNSGAWSHDISADGRFVVWDSEASNLVNDPNPLVDVFVRDTLTGKTSKVSVTAAGDDTDLWNAAPSISGDGRLVAWYARSSQYADVSTDSWNVIVRDLATGTTVNASVSSTGEPGDDSSVFPDISADGRHVAFASWASNFDPDDTNNGLLVNIGDSDLRYGQDVFVHTFGRFR